MPAKRLIDKIRMDAVLKNHVAMLFTIDINKQSHFVSMAWINEDFGPSSEENSGLWWFRVKWEDLKKELLCQNPEPWKVWSEKCAIHTKFCHWCLPVRVNEHCGTLWLSGSLFSSMTSTSNFQAKFPPQKNIWAINFPKLLPPSSFWQNEMSFRFPEPPKFSELWIPSRKTVSESTESEARNPGDVPAASHWPGGSLAFPTKKGNTCWWIVRIVEHLWKSHVFFKNTFNFQEPSKCLD